MKQTPSSDANSSSANHENPCILWKLNVHNCFNNRPPLVPVPRFSVHSMSSHHIYLNSTLILVLQSMPKCSKWSLSSISPPKPCMNFSPPPYMPHALSSYSSCSANPNNIWHEIQILKFLITHLPTVSCYFLQSKTQHIQKVPKNYNNNKVHIITFFGNYIVYSETTPSSVTTCETSDVKAARTFLCKKETGYSWFSCLNTPYTVIGLPSQDLWVYTVESMPNELPEA